MHIIECIFIAEMHSFDTFAPCTVVRLLHYSFSYACIAELNRMGETKHIICTFYEALELFRSDDLGLQLNLERHKDGEEELVLLIEASSRVGEGAERQMVDDVVDALSCDWRLGGTRH